MTISERTTNTEINKNNRNAPMTNEEWFCTLPTEEKARVLADNKLYFRMLDYDGFVEWLKEVHNG